MLKSRPHAVIFDVSDVAPSAPSLFPLQRNTIAELVILPSQDKTPRVESHGPMESALHGTGRLQLVVILSASDRSSTQLLTKKQQGASGQATEKRHMYPDKLLV
jgi:hypothetical protein